MSRLLLDVDAINKRAGSSDWYFNLDSEGKLVIVIRKRNVVDVLDAALFLKEAPLTEKQKI
jgi:hypothetical protein